MPPGLYLYPLSHSALPGTCHHSRMTLSGKVVLITGASSGIGRAAARLFAAQGARLALAARSVDKLEALAAELPEAVALPTDMLDEAAVRRMVSAAHEHYGRLDVLVNNAGRGMHVPVAQANLTDYRELFELNVLSVLNAMQAAYAVMRAQGAGRIVNVSSGTTKTLMPGLAPYSSTKHALNNLSLIARAEWEADGIVVSLVHPGMTATDFGRNSVASSPERASRYAQGDSAEYAAGLILEAAQTGEAEVYAAQVLERLQQAPGR